MRMIGRFLLWAIAAVSCVVVLATIVSLLGGRDYVVGAWENLPFIGSLLAAVVVTLIGLAVYFVPTVIAFWRGHHNALAILALNALLGWTFIGWAAALVWSLTRPAPAAVPGAGPEPRP